jgi:predicted alpha/beta superfamily hydrolase
MLTEVHELKSEHVGASIEISVGRCTVTDEMPTEALVVTDGVFQYGAAMDIGHALLCTQRFVPLLVIGIGYPGKGTLLETVAERQRDLTPTAVEGREPSGGAEPFLAFLRDELSPWLTDRYGVAVVGGSYAGHSLGGLFGAWVLLREPAMFRRYCLSSPSLWWDKGIIFDHEAEYAAKHADLDARVFIGVGAHESPAAQPAIIRRLPQEDRLKERKQVARNRVDVVAGARLFGDTLADRRYPTLQVELQVQAGEDHMTTGFVNLSRGLRYLFDYLG